jgi:hypothetical protein
VETSCMQTTGLDGSLAGVRSIAKKGLVGARKIENESVDGKFVLLSGAGILISKWRG